ncbi:glutathione S-transferase [Epibacterium ulvae]|uniref:glutathione S-transferase n=1 Tax=Epibacterium ulvae TaxID=1156985 RepID=UPI001BFC5C42|nr:glutathione S-transferase [Epibacterium ulvae]MBT8155026.1 glutathione S-transferase [Epibacterium ulvae]
MYELFIGDRLFSSWSMRGWLMLRKFDLPHQTHMIGLYRGTMAEDMKALAPAKLVPALRTPQGVVVGESLALAETLAEENPDTAMWPKDPAARATARWLCAEMISSLNALRGECSMQLRHVWDGFTVSDAVQKDLDRVAALWAHARTFSNGDGDGLFGSYSLADVFYTPVAARIVGYGLPVSDEDRAYCLALLADPIVQEWRNEALTVTYDPMPYDLDLPHREWPV